MIVVILFKSPSPQDIEGLIGRRAAGGKGLETLPIGLWDGTGSYVSDFTPALQDFQDFPIKYSPATCPLALSTVYCSIH